MSQRGGKPAQGLVQNGRQQAPPQRAPAQYDEQQDQGQEEDQQDQEQYGAEDPAQYEEEQPQEERGEDQDQYGAQDPTDGQDGEEPNEEEPAENSQSLSNGATSTQRKPGQKGQQAAKSKPTAMTNGQQKSMMNGNSKQGEQHAMTATKPAGAAGQPMKGYHPSHQNALHFMAKTASKYLQILEYMLYIH